jgi:hypothetical protein
MRSEAKGKGQKDVHIVDVDKSDEQNPSYLIPTNHFSMLKVGIH